MKPTPGIVLAMLVSIATPSSARIQFTVTAFQDSVQLDLTIVDTGGAPSINSFMIERRTYFPCGGDFFFACTFPRQVGTTMTRHYVDRTVQRNTAYTYKVIGASGCIPSGDQYEFQQVFDPKGWAEPILEDVSIGPDPVPIGHGSLVFNPYVDPPSDLLVLQQCSDSCTLIRGILYPPSELLPYVGTGTEFLLYGGLSWSNSWSYTSYVTRFVLQPCNPVTVEARSWSSVKRLYR